MILATLPRTLRTVRYLRPSQVSARLQRMVMANRHRDGGPSAPKPVTDLIDHSMAARVDSLPTPECSDVDSVQSLEQGLIRHLNQTGFLGRETIDWRLGPVETDRLWAVTLHYHQWLYELAVAVAQSPPARSETAGKLFSRYLGDWLARCDLGMPGAEHLACNSYAIATRLGWWVRSFFALDRRFKNQNAELMEHWLAAAWRQAEHLYNHLEWDLRANHLLRDAVGLAWAGRFFRGARPQAWLAKATGIAVEQAKEQVLPDGAHFERSPMYHLEVMKDFQTLAVLLEDAAASGVMRDTWHRMADYIHWFSHPDGKNAQFNDGGCRAVAAALGEDLSLPVRSDQENLQGNRFFPDSGMLVHRSDRWTVFFDVGQVGPDYQPGHAHADTLSVECSFRGHRLFVDPGCYGYDRDQRRRYDRSTAAHNTVCIDDCDSSEVWDIFRVGRRARPIEVGVDLTDDGFVGSASHTGYDHLRGRPRHRRRVEVHRSGPLRLIDAVSGRGQHVVKGSLLLAPDWSAETAENGWMLRRGEDSLLVQVASCAEITLTAEGRAYHPDYGVEVETKRLQWSYRGSLPVSITVEVNPL